MTQKTTQKFMVCAYNDIDQLVPEPERKRLVDSIINWLKAKGVEPATEEDAHLVVVAPRKDDVFLTLDDLRFFHYLLPGISKQVLYIHPTAASTFYHGKINDWCFFVRRCGFSTEELFAWLQDGFHEQLPGKQVNINEYSRYLFHKKKNLKEQKITELKEHIDECNLPQATVSDIIKLFQSEKTVSDFYDGLVHISGRYAALEHVFNRLKNQDTPDKKKKDSFPRLKEFIDACFDLRSALTALAWQKKDSSSKKRVLLIDDKPYYVKEDIKAIFQTFLPEMELIVWNPEPLNLKNVEQYSSLFQLNELLSRAIKTTCWSVDVDGESVSPLKDIKDIIVNIDFILVDILFAGDDRSEEEKGYRIIQGLHRLFRDAQDNKLIPELDDHALPEIVAISRADDMEKAHKAFLHGAAGYILKSRLLALPSALHRARYSALEPSDTTHRNFRMLYNLPHETIGLLRAATIPHDLEFHISLQENVRSTEGKKAGRKSRIQDALPMAHLLTAIPKADLHVHVGSCMSPEFLVVASLVMLVRHKPDSEEFAELQKAIPKFDKFWNENGKFTFQEGLNIDQETKGDPASLDLKDEKCIQHLAKKTRKYLNKQIDYYKKFEEDEDANSIISKYKVFRSILHKDLDLPDHMDEQRLQKGLENKPDVILFQFAMTHSGPEGNPLITDKDDLLRIFVLFLVANKYNGAGRLEVLDPRKNCLSWFEPKKAKINKTNWKALHNRFWSPAHKKSLSHKTFRRNNWELKPSAVSRGKVGLFRDNEKDGDLWPLNDLPKYDENPITYLLASGTRCRNLRTYLEGCKYSGAEHLRHPFLIHLYAQQTVHDFIRHGVIYAELRAAVSGYESRENNFTFQDACNCLKEAFQNTQCAILKKYHESRVNDEGWQKTSKENKSVWLWKEPFDIKVLFQDLNFEQTRRRFPVKVSLILTSKRHKPTRQMLQEAASATVLHSLLSSNIKTAHQFVAEDMGKCRLVGFDLAGQEDDDYPPQLFRNEFEQISKMHIPITVHAGENAPAGFVESAVLDLRARRLGHGLALADDPQLMNRLREDGVCVELCPVSNFQTNQFVPAMPTDGNSLGREYPLRAFLDNGNAVCLNTDNPIISYTNMIKECFQASYAYGGKGLSLWELLRIIRMGFVHSFLSLPERRAMLELADQVLFDLFSDPGVVESLRCMAVVKTNF